MPNNISLSARQKFRVQLQSIEYADEILDALNQFLDRFVPISGVFSSSGWSTIYEYVPENNDTTMLTLSVIGRENNIKQASFKRTAVFFKQNNTVSSINLVQSDFTNKTEDDFNARLMPSGDRILLQVKGATSNPTRWKGSLEIEKLGE